MSHPGRHSFSSFPVKCRHCDPAPCQLVCPAGAISRDGSQDLVQIDPAQCIACAMCAMVCPFDAVTFHSQNDGMPARVVAVKCDGCADRVQYGEEPACVEVCKVDALVFGEVNELMKASRLGQAGAVVAAAEAVAPPTRIVPDSVCALRAWGRSATHSREV